MQNLQIIDRTATELHDMADQEHVPSSELIEQLIIRQTNNAS
jgi:hypothetical protein